MNEPYVSNQICVLKTDKKLVAFYDKLRVASTYNYAQLHADGEYSEDGRKVRSLIGLTLLDYTNGKGDHTVSVKVNLSPDEVAYIFSRLCAGFPLFEFRQEKIFGNKDANGYSTVTKLSITRNTQATISPSLITNGKHALQAALAQKQAQGTELGEQAA